MKKCFLFAVLVFIPFIGFSSPPPAEDVFQLSAKQLDPNTLTLNWTIKPGYFLYQQRIKLSEHTDSNFHVGAIRFPKAINKTDAQGQQYPVYHDRLTLPVAILGEQAGEGLLDVHFQGCSDDGFCYPPQTLAIKLTIDKTLSLSQVNLEVNDQAAPDNAPKNKFDHLFSSNNWILIMLSFFGFGVLLAFTPCVLPMVPVLSGIIVGHGKNLSTRKAFFVSLSYVLSMSFTYAIVGAIVAVLGSNLQIIMQSPWAIGLFSLIFVLLALSMFNFYELRLPLSWQNKLASVTRSHEGGHYLGAALMGCLSTLILSPCVTAPLLGALGYIASSGNVVMGSLALFFLGLGMGTPLLLIGTSAGKLLPKAGHWMNAVKRFFGVMLLAVAIYLLERILPAALIMALWGSMLVFIGIYLGGLAKATTNSEKFFQGLGLIFLLYGLLILIGSSRGNTNPLQPMAPLNNTNISTTSSLDVVKTVGELERAIGNANGKPVMIDFYADWCTSCKVIAATVLKDPQVKSALNDFVVVKVDLTANNAATKALLRRFNVVAPPTFLFINAKGSELDTLRVIGEASVETFVSALHKTLAGKK